MKYLFIIHLLGCFCFFLQARNRDIVDTSSAIIQPLHSLSLSPLAVSYIASIPLGRHELLQLEPSWVFADVLSNSEPSKLNLNVRYRWYYNRKKRRARGHSIELNSGNFISFDLGSDFFYDNTEIVVGLRVPQVQWGFSAPIGRYFFVEIAAGFVVVYYFKINETSHALGARNRDINTTISPLILPIIDFKFGYAISGNKKEREIDKASTLL